MTTCRSLTARATCWQKFVSTCSSRSRIAAVHLSAFGTKRTSQPCRTMSAFGGKADIKLTKATRLEKEKRTGARPDRCGASADFLEARPPARRVDRRQHIAFALGRDHQRPPGVQKIEDAIFQRAPFIFVKLGMTELRLVEKRQMGRHFDFGVGVDVAGKVHLRLAVGDRDRGRGLFFLWRRARIDRIHLEMRPASDAEYSPALGVVIAQRRLILSVELEFPGAFPDIAGGECFGQTEAEYNGRDSKQPCIHRHGQPSTCFCEHPSASVSVKADRIDQFMLHCMSPLLAQSGHFATEFQCPLLGVKRTWVAPSPMSAFDPKQTSDPEGRLT